MRLGRQTIPFFLALGACAFAVAGCAAPRHAGSARPANRLPTVAPLPRDTPTPSPIADNPWDNPEVNDCSEIRNPDLMTAQTATEEVIGPSLTNDELNGVIQQGMPVVRECFKKSFPRRPGLSVQLKVGWYIGSLGLVSNGRVCRKGSTPNLPQDFKLCVLREVLHWKFPRPRNPGALFIQYPFLFSWPANSVGQVPPAAPPSPRPVPR